MTFTLTIKCDNASFVDDDGELARIVLAVARQLDDYPPVNGDSRNVRDSNGNSVGLWTMKGRQG